MTPQEFEKDLDLKPKEAAALLGINYVRWMELKRGVRKVKPYHIASMEAHLWLDEDTLQVLLRDRLRRVV